MGLFGRDGDFISYEELKEHLDLSESEYDKDEITILRVTEHVDEDGIRVTWMPDIERQIKDKKEAEE